MYHNSALVRHHLLLFVLIALTGLGVAACSQQPLPAVTLTPPTSTIAPSNTATFTPVPTETPVATPTPGPLTSAQVYEQISPAIAFLETPGGTGSGILVEGNYVLTNAHVVWPFDEVRIVFPDGSEFLNVPVSNMDLMGDFAIAGPIDINISPLRLVDGEALVIGSNVYLIGYPGEVDEFPQPTITRGLISRVREWDAIGMTYFQSDAMVAGGQSGGVLVSDMGDVIGVSGFRFGELGFALVASASDTWARVQTMMAGEDVAGLGEWRLPTLSEGGIQRKTVILSHLWDTKMFVIREPVGTEVTLELSSEIDDGGFYVTSMYGYPSFTVDDNYVGTEREDFTIEQDSPYWVSVFPNALSGGVYNLASSHTLYPHGDADEENGQITFSGRKKLGAIDYPGDEDLFLILLSKGATINVQVDSVLIDPVISIYPEGDRSSSVWDDDSGGGLFGLGAELTFEAPHNGFYYISVMNNFGSDTGGYFLTVEEPYEGAPTPVSPEPTAVPASSPFGDMALYEFPNAPFSVRYPAQWTQIPNGNFLGIACQEMTNCFADSGGLELMAVFAEDLESSVLGDITLEEYIELAVNLIEEDLEVESREAVTSDQGFSGTALIFEAAGILKGVRCVYIENGFAINIIFLAPPERFDEQKPLIDYVLTTLIVNE